MCCVLRTKAYCICAKSKNLVAQTLLQYEHNKLMHFIIPDGDMEKKRIFFCDIRKIYAPERLEEA